MEALSWEFQCPPTWTFLSCQSINLAVHLTTLELPEFTSAEDLTSDLMWTNWTVLPSSCIVSESSGYAETVSQDTTPVFKQTLLFLLGNNTTKKLKDLILTNWSRWGLYFFCLFQESTRVILFTYACKTFQSKRKREQHSLSPPGNPGIPEVTFANCRTNDKCIW